VQLRIPAEWSGFADLRGEAELAHSPCPPSLGADRPPGERLLTCSLLRGHLTSADVMAGKLGFGPSSSVAGFGLGETASDAADLKRTATCLVYMLWSWTPVVPASRLVLPSLGRFPGFDDTCSATTERADCRGSTSFTLNFALRPAHSLSTLRGPPRSGAARKTRYRESARESQLKAAPPVALFPRTGLERVVATLPHPLAGDSLTSHIARASHTRTAGSPQRCASAAHASRSASPSASSSNAVHTTCNSFRWNDAATASDDAFSLATCAGGAGRWSAEA
jgi:hypothetical protein